MFAKLRRLAPAFVGFASIFLRLSIFPLVSGEFHRASAQSTGTAPPIVVRVDLVQMDCIVEDQHGSPIHRLALKDFAVKEDGHSVSPQYLRTDHDVPLSVALLIDVSLSQSGMLPVYADAVRSLKSSLNRAETASASSLLAAAFGLCHTGQMRLRSTPQKFRS
jgi:hypothetical protein